MNYKIPEGAAQDIDQELYHAFVLDVNEKLQQYMTFFNENKFDYLDRLGHGIKSYSRTYGHVELETIGREIESSATKKETEKLKQLYETFCNYIKEHNLIGQKE